ncbi:D-alanine--D-alanine ligase [Candidatus Uhrbacteria bacterium]|nr:D-alanine--D-alanine ligase [Candidatus Uhrbacteria bacterium]
MSRLRLAVIFGGRSSEHEVSLNSAASVLAALNGKKYHLIPVGIAKDGRWFVGPGTREKLAKGKMPAKADERVFFGRPPGRLFTVSGKPAEKLDVVLPLVHGTTGEDGALQGLFELAGIPYVGSGILGSALGLDKVAQKCVLSRAGLPVARYASFRASDWQRRKSGLINEIEARLGYPCFVKPANLGSSVGISKAHHRNELVAGVRSALDHDEKVLVERAVPSAREIECGVIGNDEPQASVPGEVVPGNEFYDYEAKYVEGKSRVIVPAEVPASLAETLRQYARRAFLALDIKGLARVDFLVNAETNDVILNEVNTIPGFTKTSMFPRLWAASGLPMTKLLDELVDLAMERRMALNDRAKKGGKRR